MIPRLVGFWSLSFMLSAHVVEYRWPEVQVLPNLLLRRL